MSIPDIYSILSSIKHDPHHLSRYYRFIESCMTKNKELPEGTYTEKHHICPQSGMMFPQYKNLQANQWNLAVLTARQHLLAHRMLWKAYGGPMALAYRYMMRSNKDRSITTKTIALLKEESYIVMADGNRTRVQTQEAIEKIRKKGIGRKHSEETKKRMSESRKQYFVKLRQSKPKIVDPNQTDSENLLIDKPKKVHPNKGRKATMEARLAMSKARKGKSMPNNPVMCNETNMIFGNANLAEKYLRENGFPKADSSQINRCCEKKANRGYGFTWSRAPLVLFDKIGLPEISDDILKYEPPKETHVLVEITEAPNIETRRIYTREEMHMIVENYRSTRGVQRASIRKRCIDLYDQCIEHAIKILGYEPENFATVVQCLKHDVPPKCKNCDNPARLSHKTLNFSMFCSDACQHEHNKEALVSAARKATSDPEIMQKAVATRRNTMMKLYGVDSINKTEHGREKLSKSIKKHYAENPEARIITSESLKGKNNVISKKVKIVGRNEIFHGLGEAARWLLSELGIKTTEANIRSNLKGRSKHACGFQWEYVE